MPDHALVPAVPSVIEALREATRSRHVALEAIPAMARIFAPDYTLAEYRQHLARLLGFYQPLENAVAQVADSNDPARSITRSNDILEDLRTMGSTPDDIEHIERCRQLPQITREGLRGCTYVILGSMLGGRVIVKRLRETLGPGGSFHFYGDDHNYFQALWKSYRVELEEHGHADVDAICATAAGIFDAYAAWFLEPARVTEAL